MAMDGALNVINAMIIKPVILIVYFITYNTASDFTSIPMTMTQCELLKPQVEQQLEESNAILLSMECKYNGSRLR